MSDEKKSTPLFQSSTNFIHTVGPSPAITPGAPGSWDDRALESGQCFRDGDTYYWYYHAYSEAGPDAGYQIGVATAPSPTGPWTKYEGNPILETNEENDWESQYVACPFVIKEGDTYYMWYNSAATKDWKSFICLATAKSPLGPWTKHPGNPIINHPKVGMVHFGPAEAEKLVDKLGHTSGWQARQFLPPRAPGYGQYSVDDEISCQADSR